MLRGNQLIHPTTLSKQALDSAYEGHQRTAHIETASRANLVSWFQPDGGRPHAITATATPHEPLHMTTLPDDPRHNISFDFWGPFPIGFNLLVMICELSRFSEVVIVNSTSVERVIPQIDRVFSTLGILCIVKSDNGPPFNSHQFTQFIKELGFHHRKITPLHQQDNSESVRS